MRRTSRGESVGAAVLLTLVLGWVGVAIVWYGLERTRRAIVDGPDAAA